jgi:hypothetical protein
MSSRTAFVFTTLALSVALSVPLDAQDWEGFAAASTQAMDPVILQIIARSDLEENIAMCKGLGRRADADVRVFIDSLAAGHASRKALETEVVLRWLLSSSLDANSQEQSMHRWLAANASSVDMLLDRIDQWKDPQLRGLLLRLAVIANSAQGMHAIMAVGSGVVSELERSDGLIPSQDAALGLDFLAAARSSARSEFLPACAAIARLSRDAVLVTAARSAARDLAAAH